MVQAELRVNARSLAVPAVAVLVVRVLRHSQVRR